jgi:hypothetical protein
MREIRSYGSARGVRSNPYPYRDTLTPDAEGSALLISPRQGISGRAGRPNPTPSDLTPQPRAPDCTLGFRAPIGQWKRHRIGG